MGVYYRKYRPQKFKDVIGHDAVKALIQSSIKASKVANAYLFSGPRGVGKTTLARLIGKALNCEKIDKSKEGEPCGKCGACKSVTKGVFPDVVEIDAASNRGIDEIRDLREKVSFPPMQGKYKVYIIDEVHMLTREAFNALLKTLEEPPEYVVFVLCTTEPHKLPDTIISRCQWFELHLAAPEQLVEKLKYISAQEKTKIDPKVYSLVARIARGSYRDGESLFESLVAMAEKGKSIGLNEARKILNIPERVAINSMLDLMVKGKKKEALVKLEGLKERGFGAQQVINELIEVGRGKMLDSLGSDEGAELACILEKLIENKQKLHLIPDPYLGIEMVVVEGGCIGDDSCEFAEDERGSGGEAEVRPKKKKAVSKKLNGKGDENVAISEKWPAVVSRVGKTNVRMAGVLDGCRLVGFEDETVLIGVPNSFTESLLESDKGRAVLGEAVTEVLGSEFEVRCTIDKEGCKRASGQSDEVDGDESGEDIDEIAGIFDGEVD